MNTSLTDNHEEPLEEETADDPVPIPANPVVNGSHDLGDAPASKRASRSPESNHRAFATPIAPFACRIRLAPKRENELVLRPAAGQASRPHK